MRLTWSTNSPFVRKIVVFGLETGLDERIERVPTKTMPTTPCADLSQHNPLTKMPSMQLDDGEWLYDSRVICEYLDTLHGRAPLVPAQGATRFSVLRMQALGDGILDAGILCRYEGLRPAEFRWPTWVDSQLGKVRRALDVLEREQALLGAEELHLGQIAVACALGWLDFRGVAGDFRANHPFLARWYETFSSRPSMRATVPYDP
jgi:glutathione S-transferase